MANKITDSKKIPELTNSGNLAIVPNSPPNTDPMRQLIERWLTSCLADGLATATITDYRDKVYKFWWWSDFTHNSTKVGPHPRNVTFEEAESFAAYLRTPTMFRWGVTGHSRQTENLSAASIASYGRAVKVFFNWLEREEFIEKSPFNRSVRFTNRNKQDKVLKTVTAADLSNIFKALTQPEKLATYTGVRNLAILAMLIDSGIRRGELLSIQVKDLELEHGRCTVRGKSGQRMAHFGALYRSALINYLQHPLNENLEQESPLWLVFVKGKMALAHLA